MPMLTRMIYQQVQATLDRSGSPRGLLLDVRANEVLSVIRLSDAVDILSQLQIPVAVVLGEERLHQLAVLLHNTLSNRANIAYFIDLPDAYQFLQAHSSPN